MRCDVRPKGERREEGRVGVIRIRGKKGEGWSDKDKGKEEGRGLE